MKVHIPVTLVCVDTTGKVALAERAIRKCTEVASFKDVKLITNDVTREHGVRVDKLNGLDAYSNFVIRKLWQYVNTEHCLLVQSDGYIINPEAWARDFLSYDFIGAPWANGKTVGNGGFSLRSRKLLLATSRLYPTENAHPEDAWICMKRRSELESKFGIRFAPRHVASRFAFEGREFVGGKWNGIGSPWNNSFGFHSWLTILPPCIDKPLIFHHSGDAGDVIYSLACIKHMGGGVLFLSPDNKYPFPCNSRWAREGGDPNWVDNLAPLLESQDYIWSAKYTGRLPQCCSVDLNSFRKYYREQTNYNFRNLLDLHQLAVGTSWPQDRPWLTIDDPICTPERPIVVARTPRYHNDRFPWKDLVALHGDRMAFVGTEEEYERFWWEYKCANVKHTKTSNMLDLARVIAGCDVFIGNQSSPLAIAHGLCKRVIVETWKGNPNCMIKRPEAIHFLDGKLYIPDQWMPK